MKTQLTEIILINLLQHKSPKFSSQKMATVVKRGQKKSFPLYQFVFPKLSAYFSAYQVSAYYSFDWGKFFFSSYIEIIHSATVKFKLLVFSVDEY